MHELVLAHPPGRAFDVERGQAERGDRGRIEKCDGPPCDFAFSLRELQEIQRAFDVDLVRGARHQLGSCREQRRQVEH
jgi:hypothetical protein